MAAPAARRDRRPMTFAGAVEFEAHEVALLLGLIVAAALAACALAGGIAWLVAGRRSAFWLGALVYVPATGAVWPHGRGTTGWVAAGAVGVLVRLAAPPRVSPDARPPAGPPRGRGRRRRS
jgi:hypothetical protein